MPTTVFVNGKFYGGEGDLPISEARVSVFDAGFQHSVGLFETMVGGSEVRGIEGAAAHGEVQESWVLHLDEHLERLAGSARALGLSEQLRAAALGEAVLATVGRAGLKRARVRVTVTAGNLSMLGGARAGAGGGGAELDPTVLIVAQPVTEYPAAMFERGVLLSLAGSRANPLDPCEGHKTLNYWRRLRDLQAAAAKGAGEALVLSVTGHVCGGCVSNVFVVKGSELVTPLARGEEDGGEEKHKGVSVGSPVLPGVTRQWVMEKAEMWGMKVVKRLVTVQELIDAEEVFVTNSSWGVLPVVQVEANRIGAGVPGRYATDLRDAWVGLMPR